MSEGVGVEPYLGEDWTFRELVFSDLRRYRDEKPTWFGVLTRCLVLPGMAAVVVMRAQQRLFHRGHVRLANLLRSFALMCWSADFVPGMQVGPGLYLPHPMGVVFGGRIHIGAGVTILQGVTAGAREPGGTSHEFATVGDGAILSAHAVLVGGVRIGDHALVGANTVVVKDVPECTVVFGVPARTVGTREPDETLDSY